MFYFSTRPYVLRKQGSCLLSLLFSIQSQIHSTMASLLSSDIRNQETLAYLDNQCSRCFKFKEDNLMGFLDTLATGHDLSFTVKGLYTLPSAKHHLIRTQLQCGKENKKRCGTFCFSSTSIKGRSLFQGRMVLLNGHLDFRSQLSHFMWQSFNTLVFFGLEGNCGFQPVENSHCATEK